MNNPLRRLVPVLACIALLTAAAARETAAQAVSIASITPAAGQAGEEISITSNGLGALNVTVSVGGLPAPVLEANGNRVRFRVPEGVPPGPTDVVVSNPGGRSERVPFTMLKTSVDLTLDRVAAKTVKVPRSGGTITTTGGTGISYTLTIPDEALDEDTEITLTPISAIGRFPLADILAAVQFEPEGLRFRQAAALTVTLPGPPAPVLAGRGLLGFTMANDGEAFQLVPYSLQGSSASLTVPHFSATGIGVGVCGPSVTSAVGMDACRKIGDLLTAVSQYYVDGTLPVGVQARLSRDIDTQLDDWMFRFIDPSIQDARRLTRPEQSVDHYFDVAVRELLEIKSILLLVEPVVSLRLAPRDAAILERLIPDALKTRRQIANARCLADREHYLTHIDRVIYLTNTLTSFSVTSDGNTNGVTCMVLEVSYEYPDPVPAGGARLAASAELRFVDSLPAPGSGILPLVAFSVHPGLAVVSGQTQTVKFGTATIDPWITARLDEPATVTFSLEAISHRVDLRTVVDVRRCRDPRQPTPIGALQQVASLAAAEPACEEPPPDTGILTGRLELISNVGPGFPQQDITIDVQVKDAGPGQDPVVTSSSGTASAFIDYGDGCTSERYTGTVVGVLASDTSYGADVVLRMSFTGTREAAYLDGTTCRVSSEALAGEAFPLWGYMTGRLVYDSGLLVAIDFERQEDFGGNVLITHGRLE